MTPLFTILAVRPLVAEAWRTGTINDYTVMMESCAYLVPCPVVLVVLRVDGHQAGMRRLFAWLSDFAGRREIAGFAMRTRLASVERVFQRFGGVMTFDEGDGDKRWWAPAEPGVTWLRARRS